VDENPQTVEEIYKEIGYHLEIVDNLVRLLVTKLREVEGGKEKEVDSRSNKKTRSTPSSS